jgi:hypothetical protein
MGLLVGFHIAERLRIPIIRVQFSPFAHTLRLGWSQNACHGRSRGVDAPPAQGISFFALDQAQGGQ